MSSCPTNRDLWGAPTRSWVRSFLLLCCLCQARVLGPRVLGHMTKTDIRTGRAAGCGFRLAMPSRHERSVGHAAMTQAACRFTAIARPSSRNASISTRPNAISCTTRSRSSTMRSFPRGLSSGICPQNSRMARNDLREEEHQVRIGNQDYFLSGERMLMPTRAGQAPPDLRRFEQSRR